MDWSSQVVLITGASSGIGRGLAFELARRGARVGLLARRRELLEKIAGEIAEAGGRAVALSADVTQPDEVRAAAADTTPRLGYRTHKDRELRSGSLDASVSLPSLVPDHPR